MWIESHQSLRNHRKTGRLARKLGISKVTAIGHLHCLWWWCMDNAPDGTLAGIEVEDVAEGAEWEGDPTEFCAALAYSGFVDEEGEDHPPRVHDWHSYAGKLIEKRQKDAERKRESRRQPDSSAPSWSRNGYVQRTSNGPPRDGAGTVPNRTVPNLTQPDQENTVAPEMPAEPTPPAVAAPEVGAVAPSKKNPWWDVLVEVTGVEPTTPSEKSNYGKAVKDLRAIGASPGDIRLRGTRYRDMWPDMELTPNALLQHWSKFEHPPGVRAVHGAPTGRRDGPPPEQRIAGWRAGTPTKTG